MMACAGGSGLFFTSQIKKKVETISEIASPLDKLSSLVAGDMLKSHIAVLYLLSLKDSKSIQAHQTMLEKKKS